MKNDKNKILYIITKSNFGGAQRYVYDLATHLPKDKFEPAAALGGSGQLREKLEAAGVKTFPLAGLERDVKVFKEIRAFLNIFRVIREFKPDIVHLNSSKAGLLGGLACRLYNLPHAFYAARYPMRAKIIFTAHGWAFKEKRRTVVKKLIEYASWLTIALSHQTIAVSQDDFEKVKRFIFVQSKIRLVHNGIETPVFTDRTAGRKMVSEKIGHEIKEDALLIGTIAELHKNKGLDYAIQGVKNTPNCLYTIIGSGEDREQLQKEIADAGLGEKVFLVGQIKNAASLLKAFDIFLLPSLKEGLPYALLEAGEAGLPVIASNVGGVREVIADMSSGIIIKPKRPKEISAALQFLVDHPDKKSGFGIELQKTVQAEFTLERMIEKTVAVYEISQN